MATARQAATLPPACRIGALANVCRAAACPSQGGAALRGRRLRACRGRWEPAPGWGRGPPCVSASASSAAAAPQPGGGAQPLREPSSAPPPDVWRKVGLAVLVAAAAGAVVVQNPNGFATAMKDYVKNSALAKSGGLAAFALIFVSEIGDKTFFIAALLAMKVGRLVSFTASVSALSVMTIISVVIGRCFRHVPAFMQSSLPIGEWLGAALLVYFGVTTLKDAWNTAPAAVSSQDEELAGAEDQISSAEASGRLTTQETPWRAFMGTASLVFVAEWGDRSMLATIALGAAQSPYGVAIGAILGHTIATAIAVIGGALAGKYVSEKTVNYISGSLFLLFAVATLAGVY